MKAKRALCMLAAILLVVAMMLMFLTGCNRQVKIDGTTYLVHSANIALIKE
jgi:lipoprotein